MKSNEIQRKQREYFDATRPIRKAREHLRNIYLPKILLFKDGSIEHTYPDDFHKQDAELLSMQFRVWNLIFGEKKCPCLSQDV